MLFGEEFCHTEGEKIDLNKIKDDLNDLDLTNLNHFSLKSLDPLHSELNFKDPKVLDWCLLKTKDDFNQIIDKYPEFSDNLKKNITMDKEKIFFFIRGTAESPWVEKMEIKLPIFLDDDKVVLTFSFKDGTSYKIN